MYSRKTAGIFVCALFALTAGCARPQDANITAFANATTALSSLAKSAGDFDIEIDGKQRAAKAANDYASGSKLEFKPQDGILITGKSDADWKAIGAFLDAVSAYAAALAKANDPNLETGLSSKVSNVGSALAKVAAAKATTTGAKDQQQRITAIGAIVSDLVGLASNLYASTQIRSAMAKAQPILEEARAPLNDAINIVVADANSKLEDYRVALRTKLAAANSSDCPGSKRCAYATSFEKYDAYQAAYQEYLTLNTRLDALRGVTKAINAMITAHQKLGEDLDDTGALTQFLQAVGDIADKISDLSNVK